MRKTKFISIIMVIVLSLSVFSSCGKGSSHSKHEKDDEIIYENGNETENGSVTEAVKEVDLSGGSLKVDTSDKDFITSVEKFESFLSKHISLSVYDKKQEIGSSKNRGISYQKDYYDRYESMNYNFRFEDGSKIVLPIALEDLENMGWHLDDKGFEETRDIYYGDIVNSEGNTMSVYATKDPNTNDYIIYSISIKTFEYDYYALPEEVEFKSTDYMNFAISERVTNASTMEDVLEAFGTPDICNFQNPTASFKYICKDDKYSYFLEFSFSSEGNYLINVFYQKGEIK